MTDYPRVLLTIGNDKYQPSEEQSCWEPLKGAVNDSRRIGDYCRSRAGWLVVSAEDVKHEGFQAYARQTSLRINKATSVVVFHYSGHAEESEGQTWLIPLDTDVRVSLQALLNTLCENVSRSTQLIVLIDGCRRLRQDAGARKPAPIHQTGNLARPQVQQFYACGSGRAALEIEYEPGRWHGRFSLALLSCFEESDSLGSLFSDVRKKVEGFGLPRQIPCFAGSPDLNSVKNFFKPRTDRDKEMEKLFQKYDEEAKDRAEEAEKLRNKHQEIQQQLEKERDEFKALTSQNQELKEKCDRLECELRDSEQKQEKNQEEILQLKKKLDTTQHELRESNENLQTAFDLLDRKEGECKSVQHELQEAEARQQEAEDRQAELQELRDSHEEEIQEYRSKCDHLRAENENLEEQLSLLRNRWQAHPYVATFIGTVQEAGEAVGDFTGQLVYGVFATGMAVGGVIIGLSCVLLGLASLSPNQRR